MAQSMNREFPKGTKRITTGCQYCAVGCGYNAFLVLDSSNNGDSSDSGTITYSGVSPFITPAMINEVRFKGVPHSIAITPDSRCDLNKGNHSIRGGTLGRSVTRPDDKERLLSPQLRVKKDGSRTEFIDITWDQLNEIVAKLIVKSTGMSRSRNGSDKIAVANPDALGVKIYEHQFLENTYAATKLFYAAIGTRNVALHDRPSTAGSSPGMSDAGFSAHDFSYEDIREADVLLILGTNPYENQSVAFMQYCVGKEMIVVDPRETPTARYAVQTGGLHLQPKWLGADSLVLYALANALIQNGVKPDLPIGEPTQLNPQSPDGWRQKSRALNFDGFKAFLEAGPFTLAEAEHYSGIPKDHLQDVVERLTKERSSGVLRRIGILYEKGLIWGFNYANTAAVASLGLLLGSYGRPGRFTGRVGGHQKGWAECHVPVEAFSGSVGGYPFERQHKKGDRYSDQLLRNVGAPNGEILVNHNLDNHFFGPMEEHHTDQSGLSDGEVRLRNGLITREQPDVQVLWMIGNNYLGQTNSAEEKRQRLINRLLNGNQEIARPVKSNLDNLDHVVEVLSQRPVLIQQEMYPNPTTELCDIVIPAAGWGEDSFCRYNAQRRFKLYERFQDMPLHSKDKKKLESEASQDPMGMVNEVLRCESFLHSPKPDWLIFRDIALKMGQLMDVNLTSHFSWKTSSEVADEMARNSNRGLRGAGCSGQGKSLLGDVYLYGQKMDPSLSMHKVLGKGGDGNSTALINYSVFDETIGDNGKVSRSRVISGIYGNGVTTNGVLLPVRLNDNKLEGTQRRVRQVNGAKYFFVQAPWGEIEWAYRRINDRPAGKMRYDYSPNSLLVTNGRFNDLWNNLSHSLRNDQIRKSYPQTLPGTILEVNPTWAETQGIVPGQILRVTNFFGSFRAVASPQSSVQEGQAFALFSYPVRTNGHFHADSAFLGYVNAITDGYSDGINPIAALKYARAVVTKEYKPDAYGAPWIYPDDFSSAEGLGPTFESRNEMHRPPKWKDRTSWEFREMVVSRGLPRAYASTASLSHDKETHTLFFAPDKFLRELANPNGDHRFKFEDSVSSDTMKFTEVIDGNQSIIDEWSTIDTRTANNFLNGNTTEEGD